MIIAGTNLQFVGFWDSSFFKHNSESSGIIVEENGVRKKLTYKELRKILTKEEKQ